MNISTPDILGSVFSLSKDNFKQSFMTRSDTFDSAFKPYKKQKLSQDPETNSLSIYNHSQKVCHEPVPILLDEDDTCNNYGINDSFGNNQPLLEESEFKMLFPYAPSDLFSDKQETLYLKGFHQEKIFSVFKDKSLGFGDLIQNNFLHLVSLNYYRN